MTTEILCGPLNLCGPLWPNVAYRSLPQLSVALCSLP